MDYLNDKLDICNYINLLESVDKLQLLYFNDCQKLIFKNLKKPNLLNKEECELFELNLKLKNKYPDDLESDKLEKDNENEHLKILEYFIKKFKTDSFELTDMQLWDFLNPVYKRIIVNTIMQEKDLAI